MKRPLIVAAGLCLAALSLLSLKGRFPAAHSPVHFREAPSDDPTFSPRQTWKGETTASTRLAEFSEEEAAPAPIQDLPQEEALAAELLDRAQSAPDAALAARHRLADPGLRLQTLDTIVAEWATRSFLEAIEFAGALEDHAEQQTALSAALRGQAEGAPRWTMQLADELLGPSYAYDRLAFTVLQSWTQSSPGEALDWAAAHLAPALRTQAFGTFLRSWAEENPDAAVAWVSSLGSSVVKQEALQALGAL